MSINKKTKTRALSAACQAALTGVRRAAFNSGVSRNAVVAATFAALGKRPLLALYNAGKLELQVGLMAAALVRKAVKGLPTDGEKLMAHCRDRITVYQGADGKAALRTGMRGRRTKPEEEAYASARVGVSGIMKDAGVTVPEARGGDTSKTRTARPAAKATAKQAANDSKPVVRKYKGKEELVRYAQIQAAALLATVNRNAKIAPVELKTAVQDFSAAIKKLG